MADTTRSWRSAEDGINTVLECFQVITDALEKLAAESTDSKTVSSADGLLRKMSTFEFILTLHVLQLIFKNTGPASRILQSIAADMAISTKIIENSITILNQYRTDSSATFNKVIADAKYFANAHNIDDKLTASRVRRVPRLSGEDALDDPVTEAVERFRIAVFNVSLDCVVSQLRDRFSSDKIPIIMQMQHFAPCKLMADEQTTPDSIRDLCVFYGYDPVLISRELNEFRAAYRSVHSLVDVSDLVPKQAQETGLPTEISRPVVVATYDDNEDDDNSDVDSTGGDGGVSVSRTNSNDNTSTSDFEHWTDYSYVKPLRVIYQLSAYPTLTSMYKILASLSITSCSAERTLSRVRIIKNRLRSTMQDDWFSSLTLLACERDICESLKVEDIVDKFAALSTALRRHLI